VSNLPTETLDLETLATTIQSIHQELSRQANKAVNISLTMRNWLIGHYIAEYELRGADRAQYGETVMQRLADRLTDLKVSACEKRRLYQYLRFFQVYPEIVRSTPAQFQALMEERLTTDSSNVRSLTAQLDGGLIQQLSYTHIELLVPLESEQKRSFYQAQCIAGSWSVRQLKRQINSLLYERSQLSTDQQKLAKNTAQSNAAVATQSASGEFQIRDPYVFEFLGLRPREVMSESHLEDELLDKLQEFLMELGQGFCFEARQRRVLIGDTYYFIDLVFYHRILKCHVLVDLKLDEFTHEHIGQLNTYVSWYDRNVRCETDNPPIGILLCTDRDHALVEYALAGMDNQLFVSRYQLELPSKEVLAAQIAQERSRIERES
jgi:predicted nuclease of restriction endonuclease-like (RecB) superfamily